MKIRESNSASSVTQTRQISTVGQKFKRSSKCSTEYYIPLPADYPTYSNSNMVFWPRHGDSIPSKTEWCISRKKVQYHEEETSQKVLRPECQTLSWNTQKTASFPGTDLTTSKTELGDGKINESQQYKSPRNTWNHHPIAAIFYIWNFRPEIHVTKSVC